MGLLDGFNMDDPQTQGLLAAAAQMLQQSGPSRLPSSLGQIAGGGFGAYTQSLAEQKKLKQEQEFKDEQLRIAKLNELRSQTDFDNKQAWYKGLPGAGVQPQAAPNQPQAMGVGLPQAGGAAPQAIGGGATGPNGLTLDQITRGAMLGIPGMKESLDAYKYQNDPQKLEGGSIYRDRITGQERTIPKIGEGISMGANRQYEEAPGYSAANARIKGAETAATEAAKAGQDLVTVNFPSGPIQMTREQAVRFASNAGQQSPALPSGFPSVSPTQQTGADNERLSILNAELQKETDPTNRAALQREIAATSARLQSGTPFGGSNGVGIPLQNPAQAAAEKEALVGRAQTSVEREKDKPVALAAVQSSLSGLDRLKSEAAAIYADPQLTRITGMMSKFPNIPGSGATDVQARLETLKSQVGFAVLQAMRDASKTGGALGAVSDRENSMLQSNIAALDTTQSPEAFKAALKRIVDYADGAKDRLKTAYSNTYLGGTSAAPDAAGSKIATLSDIAATAKASGRSTAEVTAALRARGYTIGGQ